MFILFKYKLILYKYKLMESEPEPMPDDIIQQDILLDDIKEFRKIISGLLYNVNLHYNKNDECDAILNDFNGLPDVGPLNYEYEYKGYDNVLSDYRKHKNYIGKIMERLKNAKNTVCDNIHNECHDSGLYQYYYLGVDIYKH
jgi:hypothetical protein